MGCDIHLYAEKKIGDKWVCLNPLVWFDSTCTIRCPEEYDVWRNYWLFAFMANVRHTIVGGLGDPRWLPNDVSAEVAEAYADWHCGCHSTSWCSYNELSNIPDVEIADQMRRLPTAICGSIDQMKKFVVQYGDWNGQEHDYSKIRFVFWFDN